MMRTQSGRSRSLICTILAVVLTAAALPAAAPAPAVAETAETYRYLSRWPQPTWHLDTPTGVAITPAGVTYVVDSIHNRVERYAPNGDRTGRWGETGNAPGRFSSPYGVAVDSQGSVYVTDRGNQRVQKFDANGVFLTQWGGSGNAAGQFNGPTAIAVDNAGNVYVCDTVNCRVQKFTSNGVFLGMWGSPGSQHGQFYSPTGVAVDNAGHVYVSDRTTYRIQKFDTSGNWATEWGRKSTIFDQPIGTFNEPTGLAVDSLGNLYVCDSRNHRIQKFDPQGNGVTMWGSKGYEDGHYNTPLSIACGGSGDNTYVEVADSENDRVKKSTAAGVTLGVMGSYGESWGRFKFATGVTVDPEGRVFATDRDNGRVQRFTFDGTLLPLPPFDKPGWGTKTNVTQGMMIRNYDFDQPSAISADPFGYVVVVDSDTNVVQKFRYDGSWDQNCVMFGSKGTADGWFTAPKGVATDASGNIFVADTGNNRIQKFDPDGHFLTKWGDIGAAGGKFNAPAGVACDPAGNVYVADTGNHRVQKFTSSGAFVTQWGSLGTADGQLSSPAGIGCDSLGNVFVADTGNNRIQKFDASGALLAKWGREGAEAGEFEHPTGIAVAPNGLVYVADRDNHRIQRFVPPLGISVNGVEDGGAYQGQVTWGVSFVGTDIVSRSITVNGTPVTWTAPETRQTLSSEAVYNLVATARDSTGYQVERRLRFWIDRTDPVTALSALPVYDDSAFLSFVPTDTLSGVATTYWRVDQGPMSQGTSMTVSTSGTHTVEYWSVDRAGNEESHKTATFQVRDTHAPVTTSDAQQAYSDSAVIHLMPTDVGSSVARTWYRLDSGTASEGVTVRCSDIGTHTLEFWSEDAFGNVEDTSTATFRIVASTRLGLTRSTSRVYYGSTFRLTATLSEGVSGRALAGETVVFERQSGSTWVTLGQVTSTTGTYAFTVRPTAGAWYRARFAGHGDHAASSSSSGQVFVLAKVGTPSTATTVYRNRWTSVRGTILPGHASGTVSVRLERYESGAWRYKGSYASRISGTAYSGRVVYRLSGRWRVRAYHTCSGHVVAASGYRYITVR